jgi:hypothetical protein
MSTENNELRYEDAAEPALVSTPDGTVITQGWISKLSRQLYTGHNAEHHARYHDATDFPCECGLRRAEKHYTICKVCRDKAIDAKWADLLAKAIDWDGKTPLCDYDGDNYLFDENQVQDHIDNHIAEGGTVETLRLVLCEPDNGSQFEMAEFLCDSLPEDGDLDDAEINKVVNDWIDAHAPFSWRPTSKAINPKSLSALFT